MSELDDAIELVENSGNNFHCRVNNYFQEKDWHTLISPYYLDNAANKPREIDLISEKEWWYQDRYSGVKGSVNIKLFIECKYISNLTAFWFSRKDTNSAKQWLTTNASLRENTTFIENHHYLSSGENVAKLFAGKTNRNTENEVMYKALNQSLNAMVYLRHQASIIPVDRNRHRPTLGTIEMPVIVCNSFDKFYRVEVDGSGEPEPITDNFQLEVNYAYSDPKGNHRSEYFLLDIVAFDKMDEYLSLLEIDQAAVYQTQDFFND